uniref:Putative secreted protein n=1 Tax=Anopheles darlingi TaxID=43151 RepID=A0A2M4DL24_ANODA
MRCWPQYEIALPVVDIILPVVGLSLLTSRKNFPNEFSSCARMHIRSWYWSMIRYSLLQLSATERNSSIFESSSPSEATMFSSSLEPSFL